MSKFFKALEQAKRDRALRKEAAPEPARFEEPPPAESPRIELAVAPPPAAEDLDGVDEHLVSLVTPAAFEAEQYRALRHVVEQLHRTANLQVVAVSSPGAGDGKTTTAINLAGALAQAPEARVLLIDADLRRPALGHLLGLGDTMGADLVGAIVDPSLSLDRIAQPRPPFNLSVICAGQAPPSPYEVLKSPRLGELIEEARRQYDYIVLDTPPLTPIQDCRVIAQWVDGFLLVVTAHRTPRRLVEEALTTLDHTKVLGIVFNQDDRSTSGRYSRYYGGYYSPQRPPPNGGPREVLRRVVRKVGGSLRRGRESAPVQDRSGRPTMSVALASWKGYRDPRQQAPFPEMTAAGRREEDLDVGPEGARPGVPEIEAHHLVEGRAAAPDHLPESREPRLGLEDPAPMPGLVLLELVRKRGSWPDQRHIPAEHVPQLRQLVEARVAKEASDRRDPWIVGEFEESVLAGLVDLAARLDERADELLMEPVVSVRVHRSELEHREGLHHLPDPHLSEKDRPARAQLHQGGDQQEERRQ